MTRVIFKSKSARQEFFSELLKSSSLKTWKNLYEHNGIKRSVFSDYRSGKLSIPKQIYEKFLTNFSKRDREYFSKRTKIVEDNWGQIIGGKKAYEINKDKFDEGRKKGILAMADLRKGFGFDPDDIELNNELAYFIGLLIGDGFTNKYGSHYLTQFVGHKQEKKYYENIICEFVKRRFNLIPRIKEPNEGNFIRVNIYSKDLFVLLTKKFNVPHGRKSRTVKIPKRILESDKEILLPFLAGIYDAEGCVFFDKRKKYSKPYPRIDLHMVNQRILVQIKRILDKENISCSFANFSNDNSRILIYGEKNIKDFLSKIPIKNPKHLIKLRDFI